MSGTIAVATIATHRYSPFARVLAASFHRHHPGVPLFFLLADGGPGPGRSVVEPERFVDLGDLEFTPAKRQDFLFRHTPTQAAIAVKAWLLSHLLDRGYDSALFLDADTLVLDDLGALFDAVRAHAISLVPHRLGPGHDIPADLRLAQAGTFNGGVVGVSNRPEARRFLRWWRERLAAECRISFEEGLFHDQRWLDLVPGFFADVGVVRDPGVDVAHWNLAERAVQLDRGKPRTAEGPVRLFHFSGFDPLQPARITRHAEPTAAADPGELGPLFHDYALRLRAAGWLEAASLPFFYDHFDSGTAIAEVARRLYASAEPSAFDDPFQTAAPRSFHTWLNQPADGAIAPARPVTRLWLSIHSQRPDLQRAFPQPLSADRDAFRRWTREHGLREYGLDPVFAPPPNRPD